MSIALLVMELSEIGFSLCFIHRPDLYEISIEIIFVSYISNLVCVTYLYLEFLKCSVIIRIEI